VFGNNVPAPMGGGSRFGNVASNSVGGSNFSLGNAVPATMGGGGLFGNVPSNSAGGGYGSFGSAQSQLQMQSQQAQVSAPQPGAYAAFDVPTGPGAERTGPSDEFVVVPPEEEDGDREQAIQPLSESTAIATETSIAATYEVEGRSTIPSDGSPHRVALLVLSLEAQPRFIAVSRARERAYLDTVVKNTSTHHFLPGKITIYMDDRYVTKTNLPYVAPGDKFVCGLGPDRGIRVRYNHDAKELDQNRSKFAAQEETYSHTVKITITNKRSTPIPSIILRDMLPISDDSRVKIVLKSPMVLMESQEVDEARPVKEGVKVRWRKMPGDGSSGEKHGWLEWICSNIPVDGEVEVLLQCDITAPSDVVVIDPVSSALFKSQSFTF